MPSFVPDSRLRLAALFAVPALCVPASPSARPVPAARSLRDPREAHLSNIRQLTFGGQNAEAYFSPDGKRLTFQSIRDAYKCDQQYVMNVDGSDVVRISTGAGRSTCGWWLQSGKRILFSSTHAASPECPPRPDMSHGYVWPVYNTYRMYTVKPDGTDLRPLYPRHLRPGQTPGYNAESVISRDGRRVVFTSDRGGDLNVWVMNVDGTHARRLTHTLGYNGGPWWSPDGSRICFRAYHPQTSHEIAEYKALLRRHLVRPTSLDLYVMRADGSHVRRITRDQSRRIANFAPTWTPDGKALVFASNRDDPQRRSFSLYRIGVDGAGLQRITYGAAFDSFPCFSPDGRHIVWESSRNAATAGELNVFYADWVP